METKPVIDVVYCAGGNRKYAKIAIDGGMKYGARLPCAVYYSPWFADQDWKNPDRKRYMTHIAKHKPHLASVLDLERPDQVDEVLSWAEEISYHVNVIMIIPKYKEAIRDIPIEINGKPVRLGYSVPTEYGGSSVPLHLFHDWPVHLLGGGPTVQLELSHYLNVASVDSNSINKNCETGAVFVGDRWMKLDRYLDFRYRGDDMPYMAFEISVPNIMFAWRMRYSGRE